jgi:hypothetical protein
MFHAINRWLARQARRIRDARLKREHQITAATGWRIERVARGTYRHYRDPGFDPWYAAIVAGDARHQACGQYGPCAYGYLTCATDTLLKTGGQR